MLGLYRAIRPLFSNVFIAINIDNGNCHIHILRVKKDRVIEEIEREFKIIDGALPINAIRLIETYKKYPFSYVGIIAKTYNQNIFHTSKIDSLNEIGIDITEYKMLKFQGGWGVYIKRNEINEIQKIFSKIYGVDYIFSPFFIIYQVIQETLDDTLRLYILQEKSNIAILIADKLKVYFGGYFLIESEVRDEKNETPPLDSMIEKHEDPLDEFEDLSLDFIQEADKTDEDFSQDTQEASQAVDELTKASTIVSIIQNSLNEFYSNDFYDEGFVQEVVFLDNTAMIPETLSYIEQATLLDVKRQQINLMDELLEAIQMEFKGK